MGEAAAVIRRRGSGPDSLPRRMYGLPELMTDVTGYSFHPLRLVGDRIVIVILFKSTECPVCPNLLHKLAFMAGYPVWDPEFQQETQLEQWTDPLEIEATPLPSEALQQTARLVLFTDATCIVICPGGRDKLSKIAREAGTAWKDTPFCTDSRDLKITTKLLAENNMRLFEGEAVPAIMEYDGTNHVIDFGRAPGRYGDLQLLSFLCRRRGQIEADTIHTISYATQLLQRTSEIETRLSSSRHRRTDFLPSEILEHIISHIPAEEVNMQWAKVSISWFLATLAAARNHVRGAIKETEDMMSVKDGRPVHLSYNSRQYPPGTEIRWFSINAVESQSREVMKWCNVICRVVGYKI